MKTKNPGLFIHVNLTLTVNDDSYYYNEPKAQTQIDFSVPEAMFTGSAFSKMVSDCLAQTMKDFDAAKQENDARLAREALENA